MSSPATPAPEPESAPRESMRDKLVLEQMNSEYRILQDKLDKIGGFRTTIRGWSITLVVASIIAAGSSKQVSPFFLSLLFIFIYAFDAMERKQNRYANIFGARILQLERRMRDELRGRSKDDPVLGFYPGIAHHLHSSLKGRSSRHFDWFRDADRFFYVAQVVALVIAMVALRFWGTAPKSPEIQNVFQTDSTRPIYEIEKPETSDTAQTSQKTEERKNVKQKGN